MSVEFRMTGMEQFKQKMDRLGNPKKAKSIARKAARQAMNIVRDSARLNARAVDDPETAEKIFKNISVAAGRSRDPNVIVMRVGVRGGASFSNKNPPKLSGGDTRHWRWVEFGSANNIAVPFMRPALSSNFQQVADKFAQVFNTEIDKELA